MSCRWTIALLTLFALASVSADDAYAAWSAGRPAESLAPLHQRATTTSTWDAWLDLGLCAVAADRRGPAVVWLLEAQRRATARNEPRQALAAIGVPLPDGYANRIGVIAEPGSGSLALPLAALAGILIGFSIFGKRGRWLALLLGIGAALTISPGIIAGWLDSRHQWIGAATDTQLLDSTGAPLRSIAAGTIAERLPGAVWNGRVAVRLSDGTQGWLTDADTHATP